jgi:hypothetical protein
MITEETTTAITEQLDKLVALGSPEQIRDFFQAEQITGMRGRADRCPIQQYLAREVDTTVCRVKMRQTFVGAEPPTFGPWPAVHNPDLVAEFIRLFDKGYYPELEAL